jgi:tungstate transport system substrate-binding protein
VVVGRIPVTHGKIPLGNMEIMVEGDPEMRRPFVVIEANVNRFPTTNSTGARALADWLVGKQGQTFLIEYGRKQAGGIPLFYPLNFQR